ncbi:MAG: conjugal transfer protein [Sodalis sp. (in: enterobacteria)]|uniref:conjugal transfer protein n=1 Tax=Sodalis sp. (in: enterobacteria) TaxID=1898979 RepID=UPI0039E2534E
MMNQLHRRIYQLTFSADDRIEIYDNVRQYLLDGISIENVFEKLILNYTRRVKQPNHPVALIVREWLGNVANGFSLAESMREWIPAQELSVIDSCDAANRLPAGFLNAIRIVQASDKIKKSIRSSLTVSLYLLSLMFGIISMICVFLVPILKQSVPLSEWSTAQMCIYYLYVFLTDYSLLALLFMVMVAYGIMKSLPRWTGNLRFHADKYPPWSLYKNLYGATFILNVDAMLSSGIPIEEAVQKMLSASASAWLNERLQATLNAMGSGGEENLWHALDITGYDFPGEEAIIKMQSLFDTANKEGSLKQFGDKWLEKTICSVEKTGERIKFFCMFATGIGLCAIIAIMYDLIQREFHI